MFIAMHRSSFENSVGVKCASIQMIEVCINEMRYSTPTEFGSSGSSDLL